MTFAPSFARPIAIALPRPCAAPVTIALLPCTLPLMLLFSLFASEYCDGGYSLNSVVSHLTTQELCRSGYSFHSSIRLYAIFNRNPAGKVYRFENLEDAVVVVQAFPDHTMLENGRIALGCVHIKSLEVLQRSSLQEPVA